LFVPKDFPVVIAVCIILVALAGVAGFFSVRLAARRADNTIVMGLLMLATVFGVAAIFVLTFLGKTRSG
jgi:hypothetical protein